jgi:2-alkyl-3-oxoalkanoate reductase
MKNMNQILVTGATGFLGSRTVERLSAMPGLSVRATGRKLKTNNQVKADNVHYMLGDLNDSDFVSQLVDGVDCIVHAAALSSPWGSKDDFWESNVNPTKLLLEAAAREEVKRFVFISTPSMYFEMKSLFGIKESNSLPRPINQYAASKREAERLIRAATVPYVILRPRALIGRGDTVILPRILRAHKEARLRQMGNGKNKVDVTPVVNVVDAIVLGLEAQGKALNETYNISNGDPEALWPMLKTLLDNLSLPPLNKSIPIPLILTVARLMEWHARWLNGNQEPTLTVYGVGTMTMNFSMDISKAQNLLGYTPRQSVKEALDDFIEWHLKTSR